MSTCPICNQENAINIRFCVNCGSDLEAVNKTLLFENESLNHAKEVSVLRGRVVEYKHRIERLEMKVFDVQGRKFLQFLLFFVAFLLLWGYFRHIFKIQKASIQEKNEAVSFLHQQLVNSSNQNEIFRVELEKWRNRPVPKFYYGRTVAFTPPLLDTVYYIVQPRDYMEAVALYFYNDKTRYQSLCELNNINDPNVLPQNDTLTIPPQ